MRCFLRTESSHGGKCDEEHHVGEPGVENWESAVDGEEIEGGDNVAGIIFVFHLVVDHILHMQLQNNERTRRKNPVFHDILIIAVLISALKPEQKVV